MIWHVDYRYSGNVPVAQQYYRREGLQRVNLCEEDRKRVGLDLAIFTRHYQLSGGITITVIMRKVQDQIYPICKIHVPLTLSKTFLSYKEASFYGIPTYGNLSWTTGIAAAVNFTYCNQNLLDLTVTVTNTDASTSTDSLKNLSFFPHIPAIVQKIGDYIPLTGTAANGVIGLDLPFEPTDEQAAYQPATDSLQYGGYRISRGFSAGTPTSKSEGGDSGLTSDTSGNNHAKRTTTILTEFGYWAGNTDWAGTRENILTWNAAPGRLLEGHVEWGQIGYASATNRQLEFPDYHNVFYDGELLATAPGHVSGAAIYWHAPDPDKPDAKTEPWLIVACHVYNYRSDLQVEYHTREFKFFAKKVRQQMNHTTFQYELYLELNKHRANIGLPPFFLFDPEVNVAQTWAEYMGTADDYVHGDFQQRFIDEYDSFAWYGENLIQYDDSGGFTAEEVMDFWMASPGHRSNIEYDMLSGIEVGGGAGVMFGSSSGSPAGKTYHVTDFIQPTMLPPGFGAQEWMEVGTYLYDGDPGATGGFQYYKGIQPCFFNPDGDRAVTQRITALGVIEFVELTFDFSGLYETTPVITMASTENDAKGTPKTFGFDYDSEGKVVSAEVKVRDVGLPHKGNNLYLDVNGAQVPTSFVDWWYKDISGDILYDGINLSIDTIYPMLFVDPRYKLAAWVEIHGTDRSTGTGHVKYKVAQGAKETELASFNRHIMDVEKFTTSFGAGSELIYNYQHWSFSQSFSWLHKGSYAVVNGVLVLSQVCCSNVWTFWQDDNNYFPGIYDSGEPKNLLPDLCIDNLLTWSRDDLKMAPSSYTRVDDKYPFSSGTPGDVEFISVYDHTEDMFSYWNLGYNGMSYKQIKNVISFNAINSLGRVRMRDRVEITTVARGVAKDIL